MIIDNTYFEKRSSFVPNNKGVDAQPQGSPSSQSELDFFIDKYERKLLLNAFGITLYNELKTASENLPFTGKWKDLVDGKDYTIDGKTYRWDGLKGHNKQSLIAHYVFCQFLQNDEGTYTTSGVIKNTSKGSKIMSPITKYVKNWNQFLELYQSEENGVVRSLYQYLNDANKLDATAFPNFEFTFYKPINRFGL